MKHPGIIKILSVILAVTFSILNISTHCYAMALPMQLNPVKTCSLKPVYGEIRGNFEAHKCPQAGLGTLTSGVAVGLTGGEGGLLGTLKTGVTNIAENYLTLGAPTDNNPWAMASYQARLQNFVQQVGEVGLLDTLENYTASYMASAGAGALASTGYLLITNAINQIKKPNTENLTPNTSDPASVRLSLTGISVKDYLTTQNNQLGFNKYLGTDAQGNEVFQFTPWQTIIAEGGSGDVYVDTGIPEPQPGTSTESLPVYTDSRVFTDPAKVSKVFNSKPVVLEKELTTSDGVTFDARVEIKDGIISTYVNNVFIGYGLPSYAISPESITNNQSQLGDGPIYIISNGINNPYEEGTPADSSRYFVQGLIAQNVNPNNICYLPMYERTTFLSGSGIWIADEIFGLHSAANEMYMKYEWLGQNSLEYQKQEKIMVWYSGTGNPGLQSLDKFNNMNVSYVVTYGIPTLKGLFTPYQVDNPNFKVHINIYGSEDPFTKMGLAGPRTILDSQGNNVSVNINILGADHGDFAYNPKKVEQEVSMERFIIGLDPYLDVDGSLISNIENQLTEFNQSVAKFNAYVTKRANDPERLKTFLLDTPGIEPIYKNGKLVEYKVDVTKIQYNE